MTINEIQNRIISDMASFEEWFDKYEYLVEQGRRLGTLEDRFRVDANLIKGCQSSVWVHADLIEGRMRFGADSDTRITRGMIALLLRVLNDQTPGDILAADLYFLQQTGLSTNLSPSRANGLASIVLQMKRYAEQALR
jgi:cysteine desulfuration protein SufE